MQRPNIVFPNISKNKFCLFNREAFLKVQFVYFFVDLFFDSIIEVRNGIVYADEVDRMRAGGGYPGTHPGFC